MTRWPLEIEIPEYLFVRLVAGSSQLPGTAMDLEGTSLFGSRPLSLKIQLLI